MVATRRDFWWFLGIRCRRADRIPCGKISDEETDWCNRRILCRPKPRRRTFAFRISSFWRFANVVDCACVYSDWCNDRRHHLRNKQTRSTESKRFIDIVSTIVTVIATHPAEDAMLMARG